MITYLATKSCYLVEVGFCLNLQNLRLTLQRGQMRGSLCRGLGGERTPSLLPLWQWEEELDRGWGLLPWRKVALFFRGGHKRSHCYVEVDLLFLCCFTFSSLLIYKDKDKPKDKDKDKDRNDFLALCTPQFSFTFFSFSSNCQYQLSIALM